MQFSVLLWPKPGPWPWNGTWAKPNKSEFFYQYQEMHYVHLNQEIVELFSQKHSMFILICIVAQSKHASFSGLLFNLIVFSNEKL